jgi:hypothetical protein
VSPFTDQALPFAAGSHTSYKAAVSSARTRGEKTQRYLAYLRTGGPKSDHESAAALGLPLSSITSIRNGTMDCGLVRRHGETMGPYMKSVSLWGLVETRCQRE